MKSKFILPFWAAALLGTRFLPSLVPSTLGLCRMYVFSHLQFCIPLYQCHNADLHICRPPSFSPSLYFIINIIIVHIYSLLFSVIINRHKKWPFPLCSLACTSAFFLLVGECCRSFNPEFVVSFKYIYYSLTFRGIGERKQNQKLEKEKKKKNWNWRYF